MDGQTKQPHREPASPGTPAVDPAAWRAEDMLATDDWIHTLSAAEIHDLMNAVTKAELQGIAIKDLTRQSFALPVLGPVLEEIYRELTEGRGFVLVRGLPVADITREQAGAAFYGMGTYLGRAVSQNPMGHGALAITHARYVHRIGRPGLHHSPPGRPTFCPSQCE